MNKRIKLVICIGIAIVAVIAAISERVHAAEPAPPVIYLPSAVVSNVLVYLNGRPYQEVAVLMGGLQRCLQDQVPDEKGVTVPHGNCPEITEALRRAHMPPAKPLPNPPPAR